MLEDVEQLALVIDGAPQVHAPVADPHGHFVRIPAAGGADRRRRIWLRSAARLDHRVARRLVAFLEAALRRSSSTSRTHTSRAKR